MTITGFYCFAGGFLVLSIIIPGKYLFIYLLQYVIIAVVRYKVVRVMSKHIDTLSPLEKIGIGVLRPLLPKLI